MLCFGLKPKRKIDGILINMHLISPTLTDDFQKVDQLIQENLNSDIDLINQVCRYIIDSGGKRLRPQLCLLVARILGYKGSHHIVMATVIEFIHTATLLHDDVVDESNQRRGNQTVNSLWGNAPSVLIGDFLYSRAFQLMIQPQNLDILDVIADTTNRISEGEVMQLINTGDTALSEAQYHLMIYRKTACLFETATAMGGYLTNADEKTMVGLKNYGKYLGIAFQIMDDVLDYVGEDQIMGKSAGDDFVEGLITLPVIHSLRQGSEEQKQSILKILEAPSIENLPNLIAILNATDSIKYAREEAEQYALKAQQSISFLEPSAEKQALLDVAINATKRLK